MTKLKQDIKVLLTASPDALNRMVLYRYGEVMESM